jgi:hypothetical protein
MLFGMKRAYCGDERGRVACLDNKEGRENPF